MAEVQGFLASLVLDTVDITQQVSTTPLARSKAVLNKPTMANDPNMVSIPGMESGTLSVSGFLSDTEHNALELTWAKDVPVAFSLVAETGQTTDPQWDGFVTLTSFTVEPDESGAWTFSIEGDTSGPVAYTPSAA